MMSRWNLTTTKARAILRKGPATLRNIVYAKFAYWPVSRIDGCDLQHVPTYCISLPTARRRRELIESQVRKLGLTQFEFVAAVDARTLSYAALEHNGGYDAAQSKLYHPHGLTLNEIACSLSHASVYADIVNRGQDVAVIVEDDALFIDSRLRAFRLSEVPEDFDVVFLNSFRSDEPPRGRHEGHLFDVTSYSGSSAAYLVSQKGAQKLSQACRPIVHAADGLLGRCMELSPGEKHPFKQVGATTSLKCYLLYPDCVLNGSTCHYHISEIQPHCSST